MDPMTQSAQISSSQGFADGQNSAAKESKLSDSFLSSSPVSLIQSPQDKKLVPGSEKPCEGVATLLRFPSQPGSFSPSSYGTEVRSVDGEQDSPIKVSPVSERIKALEALAAKKKEPDFRGNGNFTHFRDRHNEKLFSEMSKSPSEVQKSPPETSKSLSEAQKSPSEKFIPTLQKTGGDQESPESPFEILEDMRQVNELEETEQWMKTHLPPAPDFDTEGLIEGTNTSPSKMNDLDLPAAFAGVPDAFMDGPVETSKLKEELVGAPKSGVEEEFGINFLPTAYMWDQKSSAEAPSDLDSVIQSSLADFGSTSAPLSNPPCTDDDQSISQEKKASWSGDLEQLETNEADSSGESDDTVIEDGVVAPASVLPSNDTSTLPTSTAPDLSTSENETPPPKSERKLMQVPTINVIETDEPNYSDEEMEMEPEAEQVEDYEVVKDPAIEAQKASEPENCKTELPKTRPLETEFMEGYSPPSSPVDSEEEYSPKHKIVKSVSDTSHQPPLISEVPPSPPGSIDSTSDFMQSKFDKSHTAEVNSEPSPVVSNEKVDFPDNDDEWSEIPDVSVRPTKTDLLSKESTSCPPSEVDKKSSTAAKEAFMETAPLSRSTFMQDDIYDRQSFDSEFDVTASLDHNESHELRNAKERFLSDSVQRNVAEGAFDLEGAILLGEEDSIRPDGQPLLEEFPTNPYSCFESETMGPINEQASTGKMTTDKVVDNLKNDNTLLFENPGSDIQKNPEMGLHAPDTINSSEKINNDGSISEPMDSFVEFMRECLKSSPFEEADGGYQTVSSKIENTTTSSSPSITSPSMVMDLEQEHLTISALKQLGSSHDTEEVVKLQSKVSEQNQTKTSATSTPQTSFTSSLNASCSQSSVVSENTYSKEVEAINEWVAEAYYLAEHILMAILTHLSVKDLIHWRDPKKSGLVFGLSMLLLLSLAAFSVISVASYLLLALLCVTITFRIYKSVIQAVQKSNEGHPFKALIEKDVSIPPETFRKHVDTSLTYINRALKRMSRLFLVEDLVDSLKLAVVMWLLTYVGAVFNGITILILADILLFAVPPVYEKNKTQIDQYIDLVRTQVNATLGKLQEKLPGSMKRTKTE